MQSQRRRRRRAPQSAAIVLQLDATVLQVLATVLHWAAIVLHVEAIVLHFEETVLQVAATVLQSAETVLQLAATVLQPAETVLQLAATVLQLAAIVPATIPGPVSPSPLSRNSPIGFSGTCRPISRSSASRNLTSLQARANKWLGMGDRRPSSSLKEASRKDAPFRQGSAKNCERSRADLSPEPESGPDIMSAEREMDLTDVLRNVPPVHVAQCSLVNITFGSSADKVPSYSNAPSSSRSSVISAVRHPLKLALDAEWRLGLDVGHRSLPRWSRADD
jgi:hypothetical protein